MGNQPQDNVAIAYMQLKQQTSNILLNFEQRKPVGMAPGIQSKLSCSSQIATLNDPQEQLDLPLTSQIKAKSNNNKILYSAFQVINFNILFSFSQIQEISSHFALWICIKGKWTKFIVNRAKRLQSTIDSKSASQYMLQRVLYNTTPPNIMSYINALRGCPVWTISINDQLTKQQLKAQILKALASEVKVLLISMKQQLEIGYQVHQIRSVKDKFGKNWNIMRISNSIDPLYWKGSWSRQWNGWHSQLASQLSIMLKDPSSTYLPLQQITKNFISIGFAYIKQNYFLTQLLLQFQEDSYTSAFKIKVPSQAYLLVYGNQNIFSRIIVVKVQKGKFTQMVQNTMQEGWLIRLQLNLLQGEYCVIIVNDQFLGNIKGCNLYSSAAADTGTVQGFNWKQNLSNLCKANSYSSRHIHKYKSGTVTRTSGSFAGFYYYLYQNKDDVLCLHQKISLRDVKGAQFLQNPDNTQVHIKLNPHQKKTLIIKITEQFDSHYEFKARFTSMLLQNYGQKQLRYMTKKSKRIQQRYIQGQYISVEVKVLQFMGGISYFYDNRMQQYSYIQKIQLQSKNLRLRGLKQIETIQITLAPKQDKLIIFQVISPWQQVLFERTITSQITTDTFHYRK